MYASQKHLAHPLSPFFNMMSKPRQTLLVAALIFFISWLAWYLVNFLHLQHKTILRVASPILACPNEQIEIGTTQQFTDNGPTEVTVTGCGKSARIVCTDYTSTKNIISQYFSFELGCEEKK
jgi:hypothetical protein